ncbi:MAG: M6 family metalloprotease domain-containing protein [Bacteroidales bacterium]
MKKNTIWLLIFFLFITSENLPAVPAYPGLIKFEQPDGSIISLYLKGDEKINYAETLDGYTILVTDFGEYQYAVKDENGDLVFSGMKVSPLVQRTSDESKFLMNLEKRLKFSESQKEMMLSVWQVKADAQHKNFPSTGERTLLCILMETPDVPFIRTAEEFDALFNQLNYTFEGATGSVKDYYLENSYGQFDLSVDVVGPYTASNDMTDYSSFEGARNLMIEGIHLASDDVDYSDYDNSGDGSVDGVYMIFAGYGQEAGGGSNTIWSHAWSIWPAIQYNGVSISRYACSPERRGNSQSNPQGFITRIGVIGHEFGHVLGAPDYYDTDGEDSGGSYQGTGQWDMMAGGTWNNSGATPAHHNPYTKTYIYNWAGQQILDEPGEVILQNSVDDPNSFYRINTLTPGEYYLLENRKKTGFDAFVPGNGLLIFHVHAGIEDAGNGVNAGHPQLMYPFSAGATNYPNSSPNSYGNINSPSTPFPGSTQNTLFTDFTIPGSRAWAKSFTNKPVTDINYNQQTGEVSLNFMHDDYISDWVFWDDGYSSSSVGLNDGGVFQIAARFTPENLQELSANSLTGINVYINNPATAVDMKIWQGPGADSLIEYVSKSVAQQTSQWIFVELDEPFIINTFQELWIGAEFDDPGANVFPAGRDQATDYDGKGNMIRLDITDTESWQLLSDFDISGDWSVRAMFEKSDEPVVDFFDIMLFAIPPEGGFATGHGTFPIDKEHTIIAEPAEQYRFVNWTENGNVVTTELEYSFVVDHDRTLQANFEPISATYTNDPDFDNEIVIFPNPAQNWLTILNTSQKILHSARIINVMGKVEVFEILDDKTSDQFQIDIGNLESGVYFLHLSGVNFNSYKKVVVE